MKKYRMNKIFKHIVLVVISTHVALLANYSFAEIIPEDIATYQDKKTGITLVIARATLTGVYHIEAQDPTLAVVQMNRELEMKDQDAVANNTFKLNETEFVYTFSGILRKSDAKESIVILKNSETGENETIRLDLVKAQLYPATEGDFHNWASSRANDWYSYKSVDVYNVILENWVKRSKQIYGVEAFNPYYSSDRRDQFEVDRDLSSLSIFGGQVAINETLQTQLLNISEGENVEKTIDVKTIKGVEVQSHPYPKMLASLQANKSINLTINELTQYVPADRFMVLLQDPGKIAHLFDQKNDLYDGLSPLVGSGFVDHALLERYAGRFGLQLEQIKTWFSGKSVAELLLFTPDIFFLDNTDLTIIIRLKESAATPFKLATKLPNKIMPMKLPEGETFYLTSKDDLLFLSSNRDELEQALAVHQAQKGLGFSDEFKVMNYKLPVTADTKVYLYLSDAFIRQLTSPEIKIGQLRRASARQTMETITAMRLLYRLDQGVDVKNINELIDKGYLLPNEVTVDDYQLLENGQVESKSWGTLSNLKTLNANHVQQITAAEAAAYNAYIDRYTSFWQEFFDPIAIRGDLTDQGAFSVETFILPLIDNSIYNALREVVGSKLPEETIAPTYQQKPLAMLGFRIPAENEEVSQGIEHMLTGVMHFQLYIGHLLGNDVSVAIHDSAPIVQTQFPGLAQFNRYGQGFLGLGSSELLAVPIVGAYFTRPVSIAISLKDEGGMKRFLERFSFPKYLDEAVSDGFYNKDNETLYTSFAMFGVVRMEFSFRVENGWLHISNHPWQHNPIIGTEKYTPNHLALTVNGDEAKEILPQLSSLARESYQRSALISSGELFPWLSAYNTDAVEASKIQREMLGVATPLPSDATITRGYYGDHEVSINDWDHKILALPNFKLWLRFELGGLRTRVEFAEPKSPKLFE